MRTLYVLKNPVTLRSKCFSLETHKRSIGMENQSNMGETIFVQWWISNVKSKRNALAHTEKNKSRMEAIRKYWWIQTYDRFMSNQGMDISFVAFSYTKRIISFRSFSRLSLISSTFDIHIGTKFNDLQLSSEEWYTYHSTELKLIKRTKWMKTIIALWNNVPTYFFYIGVSIEWFWK